MDGVTSDAVLRCPVCRGDCNHIQRIVSERSQDADEAPKPYRGTRLVVDGRNHGRRPAARIDIEGECGHRWELVL